MHFEKIAIDLAPPPLLATPASSCQPPLNQLEAEASAEVQNGQIEHARPLDWDSRSSNSRKQWKKTLGKSKTKT
jgi:hypothetical protein